MKTATFILLIGVLCVACSTTQTVESRKQARQADFEALRTEEKLAVEQGQLRYGMNTNAAYIAWGEPSEVVSEGSTLTWIYREQGWREEKSTTFRTVQNSSGIHAFPEETRTLYPQERTRARIVFEDGQVKSWHFSNPTGN